MDYLIPLGRLAYTLNKSGWKTTCFFNKACFQGAMLVREGYHSHGSVMGFTKSPSSASAFTQFRDAPASMMVSSLITSVKVGQERGEENGVEKTKGVIHVSI